MLPVARMAPPRIAASGPEQDDPFAMPPAFRRIGDPPPPEVTLRAALAGLGGLSLGLALVGVAVGALLLA